jgi:hypothetical protein
MTERMWDVTMGVEDQDGELWQRTHRVIASKREDALATALAQVHAEYFHAHSVTPYNAVEVLSSRP